LLGQRLEFGNGFAAARYRHALTLSDAVHNFMNASPANATVSHRGQTTLPASIRKRWGLEDGGQIGVVDLGSAALLVPGGIAVAKAELSNVLRDHYEAGLSKIDDAELQDQ